MHTNTFNHSDVLHAYNANTKIYAMLMILITFSFVSFHLISFEAQEEERISTATTATIASHTRRHTNAVMSKYIHG